VSFAVQTLGKCAKMFPVMLWGFLILRKRYGLRDVGLAVAITGGCFVFFTLGPTASRCGGGGGGRLCSRCERRPWRPQQRRRRRRSSSAWLPAKPHTASTPSSAPRLTRVAKSAGSTLYGVALMGGYLTADGYTSTFQQKMFKGHQMSTYNQVGGGLGGAEGGQHGQEWGVGKRLWRS
jgi:adenosine 3'-phospho 5'-phosphosulfate transporter B2